MFTFLMEYENYSFPEALKYLADRAGVELPEQEYSRRGEESEQDLKKQYYWRSIKWQQSIIMYQLENRNGAHAMDIPEGAENSVMRRFTSIWTWLFQ